ncbi:unnamed protein product [Camellia sinensis]
MGNRRSFQGSPTSSAIRASAMSTSSSQAFTLWTSPPWVCDQRPIQVLLDGTSIIDLPDQVDGLKSLEKLEMRNCRSLRSLPESIGCVLTLSTLIIVNAAITELPESIGMLENLIMLRLNKCTKLCRLPASIGNLKSLLHLLMEETAVTELLENFGMLSRLMILKMAKKPDHEVSQNAENTELPSSFSNLCLLEEFDARAWKIAGIIPDDFEKLLSLVLLNLSHNDLSSLPCSLSGLSILEKLVLSHCKYLKVLPPLPSSLIELNAANCTALESISNISNLENLRNLNLANCEKLTGIPGLERLKSLRWLYMSGCSSCSSVVKSKLDKLALRNLNSLCVPGSEIPDWFTRDEVSCSKPKNRVIKAVIVGIVISIDHSIQDDLRDQSPVVAGILITILRLNVPIFNTAPLLEGVPKTDEDHFYLCRYENHTPLVLFLKDGDKIRVAMQNPSLVKGVHLKKCGIHLVFENDDDYVGDENFMREALEDTFATMVAEDNESSSATVLDLTSFQLHDLDSVELPPSLTELDLTANRLSTLDLRMMLLAQNPNHLPCTLLLLLHHRSPDDSWLTIRRSLPQLIDANDAVTGHIISTTSKNELFLTLVMEFVPETMYRVLKLYSNMNQPLPLIYVNCTLTKFSGGFAYMHTVPGVCHRDLKPQNVLVDPPEAINLASRLLQYSPSLRCTALEACAHPFFDELREPSARLPNDHPLTPLI